MRSKGGFTIRRTALRCVALRANAENAMGRGERNAS